MPFQSRALLITTCLILGLQFGPAAAQSQRNLILFVPDGLRALKVTPETAPIVVSAGADTLVAGSSVFKGGRQDYAANIAALRG